MDLFLFLIQLFFGWIAAYLISTLAHELGHVICGLCHGWNIYVSCGTDEDIQKKT